MTADLAFFLDVDNTLLDNDRAKADMGRLVAASCAGERAEAFWAIYEQVRAQEDQVDYLATLQAFQQRFPDERGFPAIADGILGYPYGQCLYPGALDVLARLRGFGAVAILSDGDPVYQPAKIARAGIAAAVNNNVLVYRHKVPMLRAAFERFPARVHVLVDDKPTILADAKAIFGDTLVTVHVQQGHYATAAADLPPDINLATVGDLLRLGAADFRSRQPAPNVQAPR